MSNDRETSGKVPRPGTLSRRATLTGIGSVVAAAIAPVSLARPASAGPKKPPRGGAQTADPLGRRGGAAAALQGGRVLFAGGFFTSALAGAQIYDPDTGSWSDAAPMLSARFGHTAVALHDGRVLVAGGRFDTPLASAEIYDPGADSWSPAAPLNQARFGHAAVLIGHGNNGAVLVTGGFFQAPLTSVELYDVDNDTWTLA